MTLVLLGTFGGMMFGCDSTTDDTSKHEVVKEHTVRDANGNVVEHSEQKTQNDTNHNMNP
jgi:hypothetical protein